MGEDNLGMTKTTSLRIIFYVALFGLLFSGYLSYQELFGEEVATCPAIGPADTVFGYPACVYGFFIYFIIAVVAGLTAWRPDDK